MTNVNVTATEILPQAGSNLYGWKLGFVDSAAKAGQNDTWTVKNAVEVIWCTVSLDATGVQDAPTLATNVITLKGAGTGASSGLVLFR